MLIKIHVVHKHRQGGKIYNNKFGHVDWMFTKIYLFFNNSGQGQIQRSSKFPQSIFIRYFKNISFLISTTSL